MQQDGKELLSVTEIADKIGINKSTVSRWLTANNVAPEATDGRAKLYSATIATKIAKEKKTDKSAKRETISPVMLLQEQVAQLKDENQFLRDHIKQLEEQLTIKDSQIESSNRLADQAQKLTSQAQQLHYLDSPMDGSKIAQKSSEDEKKQKKKHWFDWISK